MRHKITLDHVYELAVGLSYIGRQMQTVQKDAIARQKEDGSLVTSVDTLGELMIVGMVKLMLGDMPILAEESHNVMPIGGTFVSIDPLDGTRDYCAGGEGWSVSVGILEDWHPIAGIVTIPAHHRTYAAVTGKGVLQFSLEDHIWKPLQRFPRHARHGIDVRSPSLSEDQDDAYVAFADAIARPNDHGEEAPTRHAVAAGIEVMLGELSSWGPTSTGHHWDFAATACLLSESGCVMECFDGTPIPWNRVKMPPVILASSRADANRVRSALRSNSAA